MIGLLRTFMLFVANTAWRVTGSPRAGRVLLKGLAAPDAGTRTMAGILLLRERERAVPLIQEAIQKGTNLPQVLIVAGGMGAKSLEPELKRFAEHPDPKIARAAADGLRILATRQTSQAD